MKPYTSPQYTRRAIHEPYPPVKSARRIPKVKLIQRPEISLSRKSHVIDACFEALKTPPQSRTNYQIDSIMAVLKKWPSFASLGNSDYEYRQICKSMNFIFLEKNSLLFRKGDAHDIIYIVYSGKIKIYGEPDKENNYINVPLNNQSESSQNDSDSNNIDINLNINELRPESTKTISSRSSRLPLLCHHGAPPPVSSERISRRMEPISPEVLQILQIQIGRNDNFELVDVKEEKDEIGQDDFGTSDTFLNTGVATEPSYVILIYSKIYKMIIQNSQEKEMRLRSDFLMSVPELDPIREYPSYKEIYYRLSEVMSEMTIPKGFRYKSFCNGWIIIREGCLKQKRFVDFDLSTMDPRSIEDDQIGFNLNFPNGIQQIQTGEFGSHHCVADPSLSDKLNKPFTLIPDEDTKVFIINIEDIQNLIPTDIRKNIEKVILSDPSDDSLIRSWYEREKMIKWQVFRKSCSKEAKQYMKQDRIDNNRSFAARIPKPPKPIKDYQKRQINPRITAYRSIKSKITYS